MQIIYKLLISVFVILSFTSSASASQLNNKSFTLSNGMKVVVITNRKVPAISHMLWYKVGAMDEQLGQSGVAHLFEHLMFKATDKLKSGEFSKKIAFNGGNDNAATSHDYTVYYQSIASEHLELVMSLEANRMKNLKLDDEILKREINIVLEERNMRTDNKPRSQLFEQMKAALFLNHPYGRPIIGWRHEIENLTTKDAKEFYNKYYNPANAILIVAGDIDMAELKPLAEKYYGSIPAGEIYQRQNISEPPHIAERIISLQDKKIQKNEFYRLYFAPSSISGKTEHATPLILLSHILGDGETGRLYRSLVLESKIATSASTYYNDISIGQTSFNIYITPKENISFERIQNALENEIRKIINEAPTDAEMERTKNLLKAEAIYARDGLQNMANIFGNILVRGLNEDYIENWEANIDSVTKEQIIKAAEYVLQTEKSVTGLLSPKEKGGE